MLLLLMMLQLSGKCWPSLDHFRHPTASGAAVGESDQTRTAPRDHQPLYQEQPTAHMIISLLLNCSRCPAPEVDEGRERGALPLRWPTFCIDGEFRDGSTDRMSGWLSPGQVLDTQASRTVIGINFGKFLSVLYCLRRVSTARF